MNKPKLNESDVEMNLTTFNTATGESITINKTIPSQQFKDIFVTGMSVEDQQTIVDFKRNHVELNPREYGRIKIEPDVITYNDKIYVAINSPTFEEVQKEWEKLGYKLLYCKQDSALIELLNKNKMTIIIINNNEKSYIKLLAYDYSSYCPINFQEHQLLTKTFRALEVKDE